MKLLLNMNLPRSLSELLRAHGHECRHAGEVGLGTATDDTILRPAERTGETILTHDLDYGQLLAFTNAAKPSVVIFRPANTAPFALAARFARAMPHVENALEAGAIVVIEESGVRIRMLPISGDVRIP